MSLSSVFGRARRILTKPPGYIVGRVLLEAERELDRWRAPLRERRLGRDRLLSFARAASIDELWKRLAARPYPAVTTPMDGVALDRTVPGESARVIAAADLACSRTVDVLGTGPVALGNPINWSHDYRVGMSWPHGFARAIDYVNRDRPSDVKVPWEISRLQWLVPAGQAYLLTGDERYAIAVRDVIEEWIAANPLAYTVNWSCAMEAALRIFTWTWFFHVFARSTAWDDQGFRTRFLACLYLHSDFTRRHIEKADINGNHYVADLAGLAMAGSFFGSVGDAPRWASIGWEGLVEELPRQVFADGVDYEASCAYHRLVLELFWWPARCRQIAGEQVPADYVARLQRMAHFVAAYSREDGTSPLWGDADDGRALPFGGQPLGDHRYLVGLVACAFPDDDLEAVFDGPRSELVWAFGPNRAAAFADGPRKRVESAAFPRGGLYVMRDGGTHVFIDCGPVGLAGRGGHGHNDALSFEAWLDGAPLVTDCGSYVYTASFDERNRFRSTECHNTPQVDGQEINRFVDPGNLWNLHDDAKAVCTEWRTDAVEDVFVGVHRGYERLGVEARRTIRYDRKERSLAMTDVLSGTGEHAVSIPLHLAPEATVEEGSGGWRLQSAGRSFDLRVKSAEEWVADVEPCFVSRRYGVKEASHRIVWRRHGSLPAAITITLSPRAGA